MSTATNDHHHISGQTGSMTSAFSTSTIDGLLADLQDFETRGQTLYDKISDTFSDPYPAPALQRDLNMMFDKLDNLEANLEKSNFQYTTIPATADPGNVIGGPYTATQVTDLTKVDMEEKESEMARVLRNAQMVQKRLKPASLAAAATPSSVPRDS